MKQYSLLIIDDGLISEKRKPIYENILGSGFDLYYIETGADLNKIESLKVHGYVVDMVLDNWVGEKKELQKDVFTQAIELIGNKGPVFLVSSRWSPEVVGWLNNSKDKVKVEHFYEWREFIELNDRIAKSEDTNSLFIAINLNIEKELNKFYARDLTQKKPGDSVTILHISDLQFGDTMTDEDSGLLEFRIPGYLKEQKINIDFLCITGDVTYSGIPSEFDLATKWINKLCSKIFQFENYKPRVLLIPGNHDINLLLNSADTVTYSFKDSKLIFNEANSISNQHHYFGLTPFKEMAYNLTKDTNWFTIDNHLCFVNERFLNWGIRFIHLNSVVEQSHANPALASIPNKFLEKICDCLTPQENENEVFTVILSHHGPEDFKISNHNSTNRWSGIRNLIENTKTDLFLYGHHHGFSNSYGDNEEGDYIKKTIFHRTATLLLNEKARELDATTRTHTQERGFSIITLDREAGIVRKSKDLKIDRYELRGIKISKQS